MSGWPFPTLIAHRCGGALAPENTLAGLNVAARMGYRGVEFDVMLAADGVAVLIHDETLGRTTDGAGAVSQTPWPRFERLDAGARFHRAFAGEPVPSLEQALSRCLELGLWPNVEVKPASGFEADTARETARVLRAFWPSGAAMPLLSSFSEVSLETLRAEAAGFPRALLVEALPSDWPGRAERLGCCAVHVAARHLSSGDAAAIRARGLGLAVYTVNDPATAERLNAMGVDAFFTDRLDLFFPLEPSHPGRAV